MEELDGTVKHPVQQDIMVISVQRHVSVKLTCVINKQDVSQDRSKNVSFSQYLPVLLLLMLYNHLILTNNTVFHHQSKSNTYVNVIKSISMSKKHE